MGLTSVVFLVAYFSGCILAFARHPVFGLATYVAVFYLHPPSRWWGQGLIDLRWSLLAATVTLVAVLVRRRPVRGIPLRRHGVMVGLIMFLLWTVVQSLWALEFDLHLDLIVLYAKYVVLVGLIYACLDSERSLRIFLWANLFGGAYLGWLVFSEYEGGRFEGFGGPGIDDANTGGLQIVVVACVAGSLLLAERFRHRAAIVGIVPFVMNALVATISRSGFLALMSAGLLFNVLSPKRVRWSVRIFSLLGFALFVMLTNPTYWARIASLQYAGEAVEGVDTGAGRLVIIEAQWKMFLNHPFGCGHRCTVTLSPEYLDDRDLTGAPGQRGRASHNTMTTMLVEQGIPGIVLYLLLIGWTIKAVMTLRRELANDAGVLAGVFPGVAAILVAVLLGDLFVDYLKFEARWWFVGVTMALLDLTKLRRRASGNESAPTAILRSAANEREPISADGTHT